LHLEKWYAADELLEGFSFVIGTRPGYKEQELKEMICRIRAMYGTKLIEINNSEVEISSTDIKNRIRAGKSIKYLLPDGVEEYIYKNKLYLD
jgi:nicotinate-nucleotide adenylyltransferase